MAPLRPGRINLHHEWRRPRLSEIIRNPVFENGRGEGAKRFAPFNPSVQTVFHVGQTRMCQDGPATQGSRTPLHSTLEPTHDLALSQRATGLSEQHFIRQFLDHHYRRRQPLAWRASLRDSRRPAGHNSQSPCLVPISTTFGYLLDPVQAALGLRLVL